jgi:large subunit ribosomal protein L15e
MGAYKYIKESFQQSYKERGESFKARIYNWRKGPSIARIDHPTNVARARELGYKAKQGVVLARVSVRKGMRKREKASGGRKPSKSGRFFSYKKSLQAMAEERAARKFSNCEVLNSYYVGEDGGRKFFEVILLDRGHNSVLNDAFYGSVVGSRGRAYRGLTSMGKKHRGLKPSVRAVLRD